MNFYEERALEEQHSYDQEQWAADLADLDIEDARYDAEVAEWSASPAGKATAVADTLANSLARAAALVRDMSGPAEGIPF